MLPPIIFVTMNMTSGHFLHIAPLKYDAFYCLKDGVAKIKKLFSHHNGATPFKFILLSDILSCYVCALWFCRPFSVHMKTIACLSILKYPCSVLLPEVSSFLGEFFLTRIEGLRVFHTQSKKNLKNCIKQCDKKGVHASDLLSRNVIY